jgi:hypothetical protein
MHVPPSKIGQRPSGFDIAIAVFVPYVGLLLAVFYLSRTESKERGYRVLAISLVFGAICWLAWTGLFAGTRWRFGFVEEALSLLDRITQSERSTPWLVWGSILSIAVPVTLVRLVMLGMQANAWRRLGERVGLAYKPSGCIPFMHPRVMGTYRGRDVKLYRYSPLTEDVMDVVCIELGVGHSSNCYLRLEHAPIRRAIGELLGQRYPIRTQDAVFDRQFEIDSKPPSFAAAVLASANLRRRLLSVREYTKIELQGQWLSWERVGLERDEAYLCYLIDLLCDLADVIEGVEAIEQRSST